jgi:F-type H+-transporting ATPase subunit epsilon
MAEKTLHLDVVTPEKTLVSDEVSIVMAPGYFGEFGALPNHIPFLAQLQPGEVKYRIRAQDIDLERARAARERAEQRLKERQEGIDFAKAEAALQRAIARIRAAERAVI